MRIDIDIILGRIILYPENDTDLKVLEYAFKDLMKYRIELPLHISIESWDYYNERFVCGLSRHLPAITGYYSFVKYMETFDEKGTSCQIQNNQKPV